MKLSPPRWPAGVGAAGLGAPGGVAYFAPLPPPPPLVVPPAAQGWQRVGSVPGLEWLFEGNKVEALADDEWW